MRDYLFINKYLDELTQDVYEQPDDIGHSSMAKDIIFKWVSDRTDISTVVDMGCGTGFCCQFFSQLGKQYLGVDVGMSSIQPPIVQRDFTFSGFPESSFDLVFSRHSLEHSPFPLLTLMEWHRISKKYLLVVLPNPGYYTYVGRNHYSVLNIRQVKWLLRRSGWFIEQRDYSEHTEIRYFCVKRPRLGFEGYLETLDGTTLKDGQNNE